MLEKVKQWALNMNLKKAVIFFLVAGFVASIGLSAGLYSRFQDRIFEWEQFFENNEDHGGEEKEFDEEHKAGLKYRENRSDFKEREEKDGDDFSKRIHFSAGDLALIAGCGIIGVVIGAWYWVLVLILVYRKAYRMGVNTTFWILAALVFNLAALAALSLYAMLKGTCTNCGRVKTGSGRFCDRCGNLLKKECPQCGQAADVTSAYCSNCGKKLDD